MKAFKVLYGVAIFSTAAFGCRTSGTNDSAFGMADSLHIETKFVRDARLSNTEVNQVIALAKRCGVKEVAKVETFYYLPSSARGISVKSPERIDGRNRRYDSVTINRDGWELSEWATNTIRLGNFWAVPTEKHTTLLREYEIKGKRLWIQIGDGVDTAFADQAIALIFAKKIHPESSPWHDSSLERLFELEPEGLFRNDKGGYELTFKVGYTMWEVLYFEIRQDQVFITGRGSRVV